MDLQCTELCQCENMESTELMETDSDNGLDEDSDDDDNEFQTVQKCYSWYCQILLHMDDLTGFELPQTVQFAHRFGPNSENCISLF